MAVELHVWSPAFGLPSFHAECLSTVAYLNTALPHKAWKLIASNNIYLSPTRTLPVLRDGTTWISGHRRIIEYIKTKSHGNYDLDKGLSEKEVADALAYASFIHHEAIPVLSLSWYASSENFSQVVRPMYSEFLPFPVQYEVPSQHYKLAMASVSHLPWASSGLGLERSTEEPASTKLASITTLSSNKKAAANRESITLRMRLMNIVEDFLDPVQKKLGSNANILGTAEPTSLDCVLVAYLSLFLYPELPSSWLADTMKQRFPTLCRYVETHKDLMFPDDLPWQVSSQAERLTPQVWSQHMLSSTLRSYMPEILGLSNIDEDIGGTNLRGEMTSPWNGFGRVAAIAGFIVTSVAASAYHFRGTLPYSPFGLHGGQGNVEFVDTDLVVDGGERRVDTNSSHDFGFTAHDLLGL